MHQDGAYRASYDGPAYHVSVNALPLSCKLAAEPASRFYTDVPAAGLPAAPEPAWNAVNTRKRRG